MKHFILAIAIVYGISITVNCETSSSTVVFPNPIEDLCVDLFSEKFLDKPLKFGLPYEIRSTSQVSADGKQTTVFLTIRNSAGFPYIKLRAFLIRAEVESGTGGNREELVGKFDQSLNSNAAYSSIFFQRCYPRIYGLYSQPNLAYRNDDFDRLDDTSVSLVWTGDNTQGLQFRMTLVHDSDNYWINVIHKIRSNSMAEYSSLSSYTTVNQFLDDLPSTLGCGVSKGCVFWPKNQRKISKSLAFLAFKSYNKYISYELSVRVSSGVNEYAKLSFIDLVESSTHRIKDYNSFTVFCGISGDGNANLQAGYYDKDEYKRIPIVLNNMFKNIRVVKHMEGNEMYLHCKFFMKAQLDVNTEVVDTIRYNLNDASGYRIAINKARYYEDTPVALKAKAYPFITDKRIRASDTGLYFGSAFNLSIQLHIILELVAWMLLHQVALVVNCYFKHGQISQDKNVTPKYFLCYMILTFAVLFVSWGGVVLLFYHYKEYKLLLENTHAVLGIVTLALNFMQCVYLLVNAFLKQKVNSYLHKISVVIGFLSTIFSILTMFYAAFLPQINDAFRWSFLTILIFYSVSEVIKFFIFQVTDSSRKHYILVKHNIKRIFRNADAPGSLLLYLTIVELIACVVAFSYYLIMY